MTASPTTSSRSPHRARRWVLPTLVVVSLGITAFAVIRPRGAAAVPVNVVAAQRETLTRTVNGTGTVRAEVSRTLSFPTAGVVASVAVMVGDSVQPGHLLARLHTEDIERDLVVARASVASAEADLTRAEASAREGRLDLARQGENAQVALEGARAVLASAERTLSIQRELLDVGAASRQDVQQAQQTRDDAARKVQTAQADFTYARARGSEAGQAAVSQARAALETARVKVRNLQTLLGDTELRSPAAGVVSAVNVTAGNPVDTGQGAIEITDPERVYLEVPFDETRAPGLRVGQPAAVQFDALPGRTFQGTVDRVDPVARSSGQVASVNVRIRLPDSQGVKPGFTGTATVTTARLPDAVTVPLETTAEEGDKVTVWRVTPNPSGSRQPTGTAAPINVTVQERSARAAAVAGVQAGDLIVTPYPGDLKSGQAVRYNPPTTSRKAQP